MPLPNSHHKFHILFYLPCIILSNVHFNIVLSKFHFRFKQLQFKQVIFNQMVHPCFCKGPPSDSLLIILAIFLSLFFWIISCHFVLNRHLYSGHRITYLEDHLEWTDNKSFSGLKVPRHMTTSPAVAHHSWVARCFLWVLQFRQSI